MARAHGFRVYVVQAFPNRKKGKDPLNVSDTSLVRGEVVEILETLHERGTKTFAPAAPRDGEPEKPTTSVTVHEPCVISPGVVHVTVAMGESGSHRLATRKKKKPKKLEKWSPEQDHTVTFLFPRGTETRFLMVVHTIRRREPHKRLLALMAGESLNRRRTAEAAEKAERKRLREAKQELPARKNHFKLVFEAVQAVDNEYLDSILGNAKSASATFKSSSPSDRGAAQPPIERTLRISLRDSAVQEVGRSLGRRWFRRRREGEQVTQAEGVSELAALLYDRDLLDEGEGERYESAAISVNGSGGETTTIAVDTLRDVFTYPVSDGVPSIFFYYEKVASRVEVLGRQEALEVSGIDPREVEECLRGST